MDTQLGPEILVVTNTVWDCVGYHEYFGTATMSIELPTLYVWSKGAVISVIESAFFIFMMSCQFTVLLIWSEYESTKSSLKLYVPSTVQSVVPI